ncbi:hypothetical protein P0Y43_22170 [Pseudomonas entomophila]|uniref:hypothetical protein n=1 Tax=Pseudomonas entomophila TaxID=312306 RepID=UPI0023D837B8|nr:hypothetical protein [Pseudomonas entomophila]MDF0733405.1 hypothetical protein [Pseudomonas entomophila]
MINLDNFIAINDKRPGQNRFKVFGTVTVATPSVTPVLVEPAIRHKGGWEVLRLTLEDDGDVTLQALTEKPVYFERAGGTSWTQVEVDFPGGQHKLPIVTVE